MADSGGAAARPKQQPREFNPRWKGYLYIIVASLVNFSSISNLDVEDKPHFRGVYPVSLMFGTVTFFITVAILLLDRFQYCCESANKCNYTKAMDGKVEGYTLLGLTCWWIIGVAHLTQVDGIAYVANNIYFSSWFTLAACVYTLDKWSAAKDILSIEELTGLSATLKSWYCLFLASLVTMGTSSDLHHSVADDFKSSAAYGIVLGLISTLVSLFFILVHYRLIDYEFLQVGGWMELSASFFMILLWVVGVAILTSEGGIAATIGGSGCTASSNTEYAQDFSVEECFVIWEPTLEDMDETEQATETPTPTVEPSTESPTMAPTDLPTEKKEEGETSSPTINRTDAPTDGATTQSLSTELSENPTTSNATNGTFLDEAETTETDLEGPDNELGPDDQEETVVDDSIFEGNVDDDGTLNTTNNDKGDAETEDVDTGLVGDTANSTMNDMANFTVEDDFGNFTGDDDLTDFDSNLIDVEGNETARNLQGIELIGVDLEPNDLVNSTTNETANVTTNWTEIPSTSPSLQPSQIEFPTMSPTTKPPPTVAPTFINKMSCIDVLDRQIPGSNLYLASWICFFAAFNVTLRWKAAQAIQFAQAQHRKADEQAGLAEDEDIGSERDNDDGDDDGETSYVAEEDDNL